MVSLLFLVWENWLKLTALPEWAETQPPENKLKLPPKLLLNLKSLKRPKKQYYKLKKLIYKTPSFKEGVFVFILIILLST